MRGEVRSAWYSVSRAASCSPRTSALPRGIITAASQRRSDSAPRKACRRLNTCSSCLYGEADMTIDYRSFLQASEPAGEESVRSSPRRAAREGRERRVVYSREPRRPAFVGVLPYEIRHLGRFAPG